MNVKSKFFAFLTVSLIILSSFTILLTEDTEGEGTISVIDGQGTEFIFDNPAEYVVTVGVGPTSTVMDLGCLDKIVVCDIYSKTNSNSSFDALRKKIDNNTIAANGSVYSSGRDALITDIINAADQGKFNIDSDPIFITGSKTYVDPTVAELKKYGFSKILVWDEIESYEKLIDYVETISMILFGEIAEKAEQMASIPEEIEDVLNSKGTERKDAFYITYSGSVMKVGNTLSLANSMIIAAGGNSITEDSMMDNPTYETSIPDLVEGKSVVVFVDSLIWKNQDYYNQLKTQLGPYAECTVDLDSLWNNYTIRSADGVWTMACAMYPDLFSGDVPSSSGSGDEDSLPFIIAALLSVIAIIAVSYWIMRK